MGPRVDLGGCEKSRPASVFDPQTVQPACVAVLSTLYLPTDKLPASAVLKYVTKSSRWLGTVRTLRCNCIGLGLINVSLDSHK